MLKLKLQYFGHLMQRANSLEKTLMLGKTEGKRRRGQERMRWLDKITADIGYSHEIKRCLLLGRKVMINLDNILKSKDVTLMTKVHIVRAMVSPVVMYGCESWTIKKAEC